MNSITINNSTINSETPSYIVAEMSANHNGDLKLAKNIIKAAKEAGADAVKIQTYTADAITLNSHGKDFRIDSNSPWAKYDTLFNLYHEAHTPPKWHETLFNEAVKIGITMFSTPFDCASVDLLEKFDCPAYKIASPEITDIPLIKYVAEKGKPVILSSGLAELKDLNLAVKTLRENGCDQIAILKCTSVYPAPFDEINLETISDFSSRFNCIPGLSDHSLGDEIAIASVTKGAKIIEKHFQSDKSIKSPDSFFSLDYDEFKQMIKRIRNVEKAIGSVNYSITKSAMKNYNSRRSLYVSHPIKKGEIISEKNIRSVRPGYGMHPKNYFKILGKKAKNDLIIGDRITMDILD